MVSTRSRLIMYSQIILVAVAVQCQNGAKPVPALPICDCSTIKGYRVDPTSGPNYVGPDCHKCDTGCLQACFSCLSVDTNVFYFHGPQQYECEQYCGGFGGEKAAIYDSRCCYDACKCDFLSVSKRHFGDGFFVYTC